LAGCSLRFFVAGDQGGGGWPTLPETQTAPYRGMGRLPIRSGQVRLIVDLARASGRVEEELRGQAEAGVGRGWNVRWARSWAKPIWRVCSRANAQPARLGGDGSVRRRAGRPNEAGIGLDSSKQLAQPVIAMHLWVSPSNGGCSLSRNGKTGLVTGGVGAAAGRVGGSRRGPLTGLRRRASTSRTRP